MYIPLEATISIGTEKLRPKVNGSLSEITELQTEYWPTSSLFFSLEILQRHGYFSETNRSKPYLETCYTHFKFQLTCLHTQFVLRSTFSLSLVSQVLAGWSQWGACSKTCGTGTQTRTSLCRYTPGTSDPFPCPENGNNTRSCSLAQCPPCTREYPVT